MEWTTEAIKGFKEKHNLSAENLAELLGCNKSYVFMLLRGKRQASGILCRLLDCLSENLSVVNDSSSR